MMSKNFSGDEAKQKSFETCQQISSVVKTALKAYLARHPEVGVMELVTGQAFAMGGVIIENVKKEHQLEVLGIVTNAMVSSLKEVYDKK
jgi:hypothetical protein